MRRRRVAALQFVLSLVLALALWTFVSFTQNPTEQRRLQVPIATSGLPSGLVVVDTQSGVPNSINQVLDVVVSGPRTTLNQINAGDVTAVVNLSDLAPGVHQVPITVNEPRGTRVRGYDPRTLPVRLEATETRSFPIRPEIIGQPPFSVVSDDAITLSATEASASGPRDLLARVAQVRVPIDLGGRLQSYTDVLPLEAVDTTGAPVPGIALSPPQVDVTVRLEPRVDAQTVSVVPQFVGRPPFPYVVERFDWTPKSVDVIAPTIITSTLQTEPVTLTDRTQSFTQTVRLVPIPNAVTRGENNTVTVQVRIAAVGIRSNTPLYIPTVTVENLQPGLRVETPPAGLTVTVSGTFEQLSQLAGAVIEASVNVAGRGPGTYTLPVEIALPGGVEIQGNPPTTTVTLASTAPSPSPSAAP